MAHIAKYKATSVGHMLAHYRRDASSMERDNIDPKRVKNDMVVGHYTNKDGRLVVGRVVPREGEPNWGTVERRIERVNEAQKAAGKRATRKDAVVMADVVVTLPDNVRKGDEELRPIAAEVRGWEAAGKAERGTILDSIAARCAGAARAARAAIEELGDRIWALMRPRKAQRGGRSLDDAMREATEAARASEALSRNHVAPTNSRSRGQSR